MTVIVARVGITAVEVQVPCVIAGILGTGPVVVVVATVVQRTAAVVPVTGGRD